MKFKEHQTSDRHLLQELWTKQAKLYLLLLFSEADRIRVIDKYGNVVEEVKK